MGLVIGERERHYMKKRNERSQNEPIGRLSRIADFLPPPEKLIPPENTVKITIAIDDKTLKFFKSSASKHGLKYQKMMREVLKGYAQKFG